MSQGYNIFGDDFLDVFWVGEDENRAGNFRKTTIFGNAFVHDFDHNFKLINLFGKGFKVLGS